MTPATPKADPGPQTSDPGLEIPQCPHCGNLQCEVWELGGRPSVACGWAEGEVGCGMAGPICDTIEEAVAAWARLGKAAEAWENAGRVIRAMKK